MTTYRVNCIVNGINTFYQDYEIIFDATNFLRELKEQFEVNDNVIDLVTEGVLIGTKYYLNNIVATSKNGATIQFEIVGI